MKQCIFAIVFAILLLQTSSFAKSSKVKVDGTLHLEGGSIFIGEGGVDAAIDTVGIGSFIRIFVSRSTDRFFIYDKPFLGVETNSNAFTFENTFGIGGEVWRFLDNDASLSLGFGFVTGYIARPKGNYPSDNPPFEGNLNNLYAGLDLDVNWYFFKKSPVGFFFGGNMRINTNPYWKDKLGFNGYLGISFN